MKLTVWVLVIFAILSTAISVVAFRSRTEVLASRQVAHDELADRVRARARADRLEASWNPGHLVPMTEDVFAGVPDDQVRATPSDPALALPAKPTETTSIEIEWTSARQVRALIEHTFEGPHPEAAELVAGEYERLARTIPPREPR